MLKLLASAAVAFIAASGAALAQGTAPVTAPTPPAATKAPAATPTPAPASLEPSVETRFKAVDKDNSGVIDGAEVAAFKADMTRIDTDKDGKISRAEFGAAVKGGVIK